MKIKYLAGVVTLGVIVGIGTTTLVKPDRVEKLSLPVPHIIDLVDGELISIDIRDLDSKGKVSGIYNGRLSDYPYECHKFKDEEDLLDFFKNQNISTNMLDRMLNKYRIKPDSVYCKVGVKEEKSIEL
jgi:hypothetical protein